MAYKPKYKPNVGKRKGEGRGPPLAERFTAEKRAQFLAVYSTGTTVHQAAETVGVSKRAVFNHIRANEDFAAEYRKAVELNIDALEDALHTLAIGGNVTAIFGMLRARRPRVWREHYELSNTDGSILKPLAEAIRAAHSGGPV